AAAASERPAAADAPAREGEAAAPAPPAPQLGGAAVLVVDDDADTREIVRLQLESRGARVTAVSSVPEALAALAGQPFAVLLADLGLPGEDGYDLIRQVRALPPERGGDTPAAALSAYTRDTDRDRALASGFQLHLAKPIDHPRLAAAVAELRELGSGRVA
ncbi:MAG TPA: response regulator, partial [Thermoanaerobaculia bacterium]|nr:response regulator [Thermoanaerobaculia bacterium]